MDSTSTSKDKTEKDPFERKGCLIFVLATVLFSIQRFLIFSYSGYLASLGNQTAYSIHSFLFGDPPYSIFDILLGFDMPDEGLFYLLQPANWAIGITQALHFAVNIGIAYIPLWIIHKINRLAGFNKVIGYLSLISAIVIPSYFVLSLDSCTTPTRNRASTIDQPAISRFDTERYINSEFGIQFNFPSYLEVEDQSVSDRGPGGEIVKMHTITATSIDPFIGVLVRIIEDPLRNEMFPNLYPPDRTTLQILVIGEINSLEFDDTEDNKTAAREASDNTRATKISGHDAGVYSVDLESTTYGDIYVRGALIVTPTRDVSVFVLGGIESGIQGSVSEDDVDKVWNNLATSISIDY